MTSSTANLTSLMNWIDLLLVQKEAAAATFIRLSNACKTGSSEEFSRCRNRITDSCASCWRGNSAIYNKLLFFLLSHMLVGLRLPVEQRKFRTLTALILERVRNAELKLAKPSLSLSLWGVGCSSVRWGTESRICERVFWQTWRHLAFTWGWVDGCIDLISLSHLCFLLVKLSLAVSIRRIISLYLATYLSLSVSLRHRVGAKSCSSTDNCSLPPYRTIPSSNNPVTCLLPSNAVSLMLLDGFSPFSRLNEKKEHQIFRSRRARAMGRWDPRTDQKGRKESFEFRHCKNLYGRHSGSGSRSHTIYGNPDVLTADAQSQKNCRKKNQDIAWRRSW